VYHITAVPISLSLVTQTGLLENLHRLDTMIVEEVAKKGRHTVTRLGARFVERRTRRTVGALGTPWSAGRVATPCSRVALVRVSKLAGTIVLDESERQVFVVVEVIQDLVVRVTERTISRSLEGSHEDGLQNVFDGQVTNVAHGAVEFGDRGEMTVDSALGVSIPAHHAGDFAGKQNSLHALVVKRESSEKGFPYLLGTQLLGRAVGVENFHCVSERGPEVLKTAIEDVFKRVTVVLIQCHPGIL
jgi:hypothetical protein